MDIHHSKRKLRELKKVKKNLRKGTEEYKKVRSEIKELKIGLKETIQSSPEKDKVIEEINKFTEIYLRGIINLKKFTIEELEKHLHKLKQKKGLEKKEEKVEYEVKVVIGKNKQLKLF